MNLPSKNKTILQIPLYQEEEFTRKIDLDKVENLLRKHLPLEFTGNVRKIIVKTDQYMVDNNFNAYWHKGIMYVSPDQTNEMDLVDDIIHETGHSFLDSRKDEIMGDGKIRDEFLIKREYLRRSLVSFGINAPKNVFNKLTYMEDYDQIIYGELGKSKSAQFMNGLFLNPYSSLSLHEYFAVGFEFYFLGKVREVETTCPLLFERISQLALSSSMEEK